MIENIMNFFKNWNKKNDKSIANSKDAAKERLHLVLMQDRANVSADFLELMKQEIIEVIKKYIDVDESAIDVRLTNKENGDGTNGAPALYANIPILNIKNEARKIGPEDGEKQKQAKSSKIEKTTKKDEIKTKNKQSSEKVAEKVEQAEEIIEEVKAEKEENEKDKKQTSTKKKTEEKNEETEVKEEVKSENK